MVAWAGPEDGPPKISCPICGRQRCIACSAEPFHEGLTCADYSRRLACLLCKVGTVHPGVSCEAATAAARSAAAAAYAPSAAAPAPGAAAAAAISGGIAALFDAVSFWNAKPPADATTSAAAPTAAGPAAAGGLVAPVGGAGADGGAAAGPAGADASLQEWIASQVATGNVRICKRCASEFVALGATARAAYRSRKQLSIESLFLLNTSVVISLCSAGAPGDRVLQDEVPLRLPLLLQVWLRKRSVPMHA